MDPAPATNDLLNDKDTFEMWKGICRNIPKFEHETSKTKGNWLEKQVFYCLRQIGFVTLAGRVRELRGLSSIEYENDVLVFKSGAIDRLLVVECKFRRCTSMIEKELVMLFYQRVLDIANNFSSMKSQKYILPMFVSSVPLSRNAFRFCLTYGVLAIQPNFQEGSYPPMTSTRPPLGALRYQLSLKNPKNVKNVVQRLRSDIDRLHLRTVKYVPPTGQTTKALNGDLLEKGYFDILYRCNYVLRRGI